MGGGAGTLAAGPAAGSRKRSVDGAPASEPGSFPCAGWRRWRGGGVPSPTFLSSSCASILNEACDRRPRAARRGPSPSCLSAWRRNATFTSKPTVVWPEGSVAWTFLMPAVPSGRSSGRRQRHRHICLIKPACLSSTVRRFRPGGWGPDSPPYVSLPCLVCQKLGGQDIWSKGKGTLANRPETGLPFRHGKTDQRRLYAAPVRRCRHCSPPLVAALLTYTRAQRRSSVCHRRDRRQVIVRCRRQGRRTVGASAKAIQDRNPWRSIPMVLRGSPLPG